MKRFIRTKDGKIIDTEPFNCIVQDKYYKTHKNRYITNKLHIGNDIEKQADTIEELIEVGDLVKLDFIDIVVELKEIDCEYYKGLLMEHYGKDVVLEELYTKQGRNYILVAEKVNGEWRVI